jgi:leucyl aminopeptidase
MKIQLSYDHPQKAKTDLLVVILDKEQTLHDLGRSPLTNTVDRVRKDLDSKKLRREYFTPLAGRGTSRHMVVYSTSFESGLNVWESVKTSVAKALRMARDYGLEHVSIVLNTDDALPFVGKAIEGAMLGTYTFARYKKDNKERQKFYDRLKLNLIVLKAHDKQNRFYLNRYTKVCEAVNFARDLINEPGGVATPEYLVSAARKVARESKLDIKVWDARRLGKEGYNGLVEVGKGSANKPYMIRLAYRPKNKSARTLALVGKGVTFDTGGISLKPPDKMWEMKGDMSGGAAVLAAMKAIGQLKPEVNVIGIVPTAENSPDAEAQRPGDIFEARNGKTIMVDNTDAEGRLILTDGLYAAGEEKATHVIDIATLTGACVRALGPSIAGVMGNSSGLIRAVIDSGQSHGESFWELPMPEEYKEMLKTPYADLNNIGGPLAGASTAALFLQEFVPSDTEWAHLDIAGPFLMEKNWKYYEPGGVGFGAKTMIDLAERFNEYFD